MRNAKIKRIKKHILCIICKENKSFEAVWVSQSRDSFSFDKNYYFIVPEGTYLNNRILVAFYLEGVSTPVNHSFIERKTETREIVDRDTKKKKTFKLDVIKGLKFDSQLIDMLLNRKLADAFTKVHMDIPSLLLTVLLLGTLVLGVINIGMWFT